MILTYKKTHIKVSSGNLYVTPTHSTIEAMPGITAAVRADGYAITADGTADSRSIKFAYKACDATATPADIDNPAATSGCTNERQVTVIWAPRPYITNAAITSEAAILKDGRTVSNPTGAYADGTKFSKQGDNIVVTLTLGVNSQVLDTNAADQRPYIELDIGGQPRKATLLSNEASESGANWNLQFIYEVQASDYSTDGVSVKQNDLKNCAAIVTADYEVPMVGCNLPSHLTSATPVQGQRREGGRPEYDLDADNDGLIEISTAARLNLMRQDIDANGNIDGVPNAHGTVSLADAALAYYQTTGTTGFPDARKSSDGTTGCPAHRCTGYELTAHLTLTGDFEPFPNWNAVLEGNGNTISGLRIVNGSGMFQNIGNQAAILNIGFLNPNVQTNGKDGGGIIAGASAGTISNVYIHDAAISGKPGARGIGMIAGTVSGGTISNAYVTGTVTADGEDSAGTLVGNMQNGTLRNNYSRTNLGVGNGNQFRQYATVAGAHFGGNIANVWEEEDRVAVNPDSGTRTKTTAELREATSFPGWSAAWDFGDSCQYPVLNTRGHTAAS